MMRTLSSKVLAVAAAMVLATPAMAADWVRVGEGSQAVFYVDNDYVTDGAGDKVVWQRSVYKSGHARTDVRTKKRYDESRTKVAYRCSTGKYAQSVDSVYYKGRFISQSGEDWSAWESVVPGTIGEVVYDLVCK